MDSGIKTRMLIKEMNEQVTTGKEVLFEDNRSLEEIIQEIAEQEGMTFDQTMEMFKKGLKQANGQLRKVDPKKKAKSKAKKKQAKASKKRNR